jgi:hypothetical protein
MGQSQSLDGGWAKVEKLNPELWEKIVAKVKKEPGPWAAWKAEKAIKMYKKAGGKYIGKK